MSANLILKKIVAAAQDRDAAFVDRVERGGEKTKDQAMRPELSS